MKIIEKVNKAQDQKHVFYSFEFFPPKTSAGVENLHLRMERMVALEPIFVDITWGAAGSTADLTLAIAATAQKYLGVEVLMHLTCTLLKEDEVKRVLQKARDAGIQNILALRGDPEKGAAAWEPTDGGFRNAIDLVKLIRREHGDYFGIAVAGHPEGHQDSTDRDVEIQHLKEKIEAGADFVITQFFYNVEVYIQYVRDCRAKGIHCPIIPGIMAVQNYTAFQRMTEFCKTTVPQPVLDALQPIQHNDEAVKNYGVQLGVEMCQRLVEAGAPGLHFYTLNLERSVRLILSGGGYTEQAVARRQYPWRASTWGKREKEDVRPIHWANRPRSYIDRTEVWDEYPNGRWGDGRSPAFGELSDSHFYRLNVGTKEDRKAMWGEAPVELSDIYEVFARFIEGKTPKLPWCEGTLMPESQTIQSPLSAINRAGFLTINSQPAVNGAKSDHPVFGWGGPGGRVYQKAYVEFFTSPQNLKKVLLTCADRPHLNYYAVDIEGHTYSSGLKGTTALTWGVFPNQEVQQPTIFHPETFMVWREEAFRLWIDLWACLYNDESQAYALLHNIHDTFFLVAIIDNDYPNSTLWELFEEMIVDGLSSAASQSMHA